MQSGPAERLTIDTGVLTRLRESDADDVALAVRASLTHLRPWMPWAIEEAADPVAQRTRSCEAERQWEQGTDYIYALRLNDAGAVIGMFGLHRRIGPKAVEIGYWLHPEFLGVGRATKAVAVLTTTSLRLPDVTRIEIHTDEANTASAAIPRRLGYRLDRVEPKIPQAPGESHLKQIWMTP